MRKFSILKTASLFFGSILCLPAANLIIDGSFENPVITDNTFTNFPLGNTLGAWTVVGDPSGSVIIIRNNYADIGGFYDAQDGQQHLDLTGPGLTNRAGVAQTVNTVVGSNYLLSFYVGDVKNDVLPFASTVEVFLNGLTHGTFTVESTRTDSRPQWEQFSINFTATSASTEIAFLRGATADQYVGLDNVSLVGVAGEPSDAIPEPSAWMLAASGSALILLRRRMR